MELYFSTIAKLIEPLTAKGGSIGGQEYYSLDLPPYIAESIGLSHNSVFFSGLYTDLVIKKQQSKISSNTDLYRLFLFPAQQLDTLKSLYRLEVNLKNIKGSTAAITGFLEEKGLEIILCRAIDAMYGSTGRVIFIVDIEQFLKNNGASNENISKISANFHELEIDLPDFVRKKLKPLSIEIDELQHKVPSCSVVRFLKDYDTLISSLEHIDDHEFLNITGKRYGDVKSPLEEVREVLEKLKNDTTTCNKLREKEQKYLSFSQIYPKNFFDKQFEAEEKHNHEVKWTKKIVNSEANQLLLQKNEDGSVSVVLDKNIVKKIIPKENKIKAKTIFVGVIADPYNLRLSLTFKDQVEIIVPFKIKIKNVKPYLFYVFSNLEKRGVNLRIVEPTTVSGSESCALLIAGDVSQGIYRYIGLKTLEVAVKADILFNSSKQSPMIQNVDFDEIKISTQRKLEVLNGRSILSDCIHLLYFAVFDIKPDHDLHIHYKHIPLEHMLVSSLKNSKVELDFFRFLGFNLSLHENSKNEDDDCYYPSSNSKSEKAPICSRFIKRFFLEKTKMIFSP